MLYLHETHRVKGAAEDELAAAYREEGGWMDRLADGDDARLLWYVTQVHGTGPSYRVTTVTAVQDGAAWERLARRVDGGDMADWARGVDALRYDVQAKVLLAVPWSPLGGDGTELDLAAEPTGPADHEPTLFMEDTGWPDVPIGDYLRFWEEIYLPLLSGAPDSHRLLEIQACWTPALGAGRRPEGVLWQRVHRHDRLLELFTTELPPERKAPGTYMADALTYRDQWESRLLRTAGWSPRW
jgi:hypothetical protein